MRATFSASVGGVLAALIFVLATGCEQAPPPLPPAPSTPAATPAPQPEAQPRAAADTSAAEDEGGADGEAAPAPLAELLDESMRVAATRPAGAPTNTFIDRPAGAQLRVMSFNVNWDHIFPDKSVRESAKFQRIMKAVDPDVVLLQEIDKNSGERTAELLDLLVPLGDGRHWHTYKGYRNVIASKYPISHGSDEMTPAGQRGHAAALVDLPDAEFPVDLYVLNEHFKCCDGVKNDPLRQRQADAVVAWLRDCRTPGGNIDLPPRTAVIIGGDLNIVGGDQPVLTLCTGDIQDEGAYGADSPPDWDNTALTDAHPRHNGTGTDDYTWRNDGDRYAPGRLDYVIYSDAVLEAVHSFVLNTISMTEEQRVAAGLEPFDVTIDDEGVRYDHLPLVVDFIVRPTETPAPAK